jgi:hypothetical protein
MTTLKEIISKQLAEKVAERLQDEFFDTLCDRIQEIATEVMDEELSGLMDPESDDYFDLMMEAASRIAVVAK